MLYSVYSAHIFCLSYIFVIVRKPFIAIHSPMASGHQKNLNRIRDSFGIVRQQQQRGQPKMHNNRRLIKLIEVIFVADMSK